MSFDLFNEYSDDELLITDITFMGFNQKAWDYSRGARTERRYECVEEPGVLKIRDYYNYTMTNGNRDIATVERFIEWYDMDDTVGLTKKIIKEFTVKGLAELNQTIRNGRILDLFSNASSLPGGQSIVDALYAWYEHDIIEYIDRGTMAFETALKDEADEARLAVLNTAIPEFGGATVMQLLAFQLVGSFVWP